ncbi:lipoprotein [Limnobacter sp.]|uniref:LPS translocon maturation chaperone LptM n=1 Tax=Limnobacter sp. TaxID=2003368 RepID=UPI003519D2C0
MKITPLKMLATAMLLMLGLSACGQRGPLYLPEPPAPMPKPQGYEDTGHKKPQP